MNGATFEVYNWRIVCAWIQDLEISSKHPSDCYIRQKMSVAWSSPLLSVSRDTYA